MNMAIVALSVSVALVDPKKLIALGFQEVMEGARLELYDYIEQVCRAQPLPADLAGVRGQESELAAVKGVFLGKTTLVRVNDQGEVERVEFKQK